MSRKRRKSFVDQSGKTYGNWTVLYFLEKRAYADYYMCKCICGAVLAREIRSLQIGSSTSCGCVRVQNWAYGDNETAAFNLVISAYKGHAREYNRAWELTDDDCRLLFKERCFYCRAEPSNIRRGSSKAMQYASQYIYNGLDRIDNKKDYRRDNTVSCCIICNRAKRELSFEAFAEWLSRFSGKLLTLDDVRTWQDRLFGDTLAEVIPFSGAA
jgi:hypothetical protein